MACKNAYDYIRLVDDEPSLKDAVSELKQKIEHNTLLAVDCKGVSLSRKGALTILTVATEEKFYLFDVFKLGQAVFSAGLREILESYQSPEKLMFDCRQDSDALWYQFRVKLTGVLDLQLLEVIYRRENSAAKSTDQFSTKYRTDEVESIYGFRRCIELYVQDEEMVKIIDVGMKLFEDNEEAWRKRPLSKELIKCCIVDTMGMFPLYDKMKDVNGGEQARLRVASERYIDLYRQRTTRSFDEYETNAYLPLDIIPDKVSLDFAPANTACTGCDRLFPKEEFSVIQLRKGEQKCRVCKEVKRREDAENRQDWSRKDRIAARLEEESYVGYCSEDERDDERDDESEEGNYYCSEDDSW